MKTTHKLSVIALLAFAFVACNKPANTTSVEEQPKVDTVWLSDTEYFIEKKIYNFTCADGHQRAFYDLCFASEYNMGHYLGAQDNEDSKTNHFLSLEYQRYEDDPDFFEYIGGCPVRFHYITSQDKNYLYIVTGVMANSNGWTSEYQLFKVNCETEEVQFICECAAIAVNKNGFTVARARLTNEDEATCTAEEIWVMHDEYMDWDGNVVRVSNEEYDYDMMDVKYLNDDDSYLKGFKI